MSRQKTWVESNQPNPTQKQPTIKTGHNAFANTAFELEFANVRGFTKPAIPLF
jgi:hypothetical protein